MNFLECNLEKIILNTDNKLLQQRGLLISGKKRSQVKIGNYGIADIVTHRRDNQCLIIDILELKRNAIDLNSLDQSLRYARGIQRYFQIRHFENYKIQITLVGSSIANSDGLIYLTDLVYSDEIGCINNISLFTYDYDFDGISFSLHNDYRLKNEGIFSPKL